MKTIKVDVKQKHLDESERLTRQGGLTLSERDPIVLALKEQDVEEAFIGSDFAEIDQKLYKICEETKHFKSRWLRRSAVQPLSLVFIEFTGETKYRFLKNGS